MSRDILQSHKYLVFFCKKICLQEPSTVVKSGHIVIKILTFQISPSLVTLTIKIRTLLPSTSHT